MECRRLGTTSYCKAHHEGFSTSKLLGKDNHFHHFSHCGPGVSTRCPGCMCPPMPTHAPPLSQHVLVTLRCPGSVGTVPKRRFSTASHPLRPWRPARELEVHRAISQNLPKELTEDVVEMASIHLGRVEAYLRTLATMQSHRFTCPSLKVG